MLGAIIGDIVGSIYEFNNIKTKEFELINERCFFTDDTVLTVAVAQALMDSDLDNEEDVKNRLTKEIVDWGRQYPRAGYGLRFQNWLWDDVHTPYNSFGNGSAMRVSPAAWISNDLDQVLRLAKNTAEVTHNHPEGIKGAQATAAAILLAGKKKSMKEIREYIEDNYYKLGFTLGEIRPTYKFNETCQDTVPQAIVAFLESDSFEDAIKNAISIGGDSDTIAAITGSIAEAYYAIPQSLYDFAMSKLDARLKKVVRKFINLYVGI
ncbi:MAG: ADP-ribosylglycohydrolase family protein [Natronincolaceae bacterium]|nr:ADP-ribosylglycohydrolase family protein [Bacillota bacterium]NLK90719.1 ADP-ribosylglycohydrolase [Clostridiales bacterium]